MQLKLRYDDDGEVKPCLNCDYPVATMDYTGHHDNERLNEVYLCEICASTMLSAALFYPDQCPDPVLHQAVGWIANMLLEELRGIHPKKS
jgi:protein-arginine kinase activator protein McsA